MKISSFLALMLLMAMTGDAISCPLGEIETALGRPLEGLSRLERDATDIQSTEGGQWEIFREKDGRVHTIIRTDFGEIGRTETRLTVINRRTYGIAVSTITYTRHLYQTEEGPLGTRSRNTDFHYYCDGKPAIANPEALELQKQMLTDKDVADFTKGLAR